jgi:hypothetical protein
MARGGYYGQVQDDAGNVVPEASIRVRRLSAGKPPAQLFAARDGGAALGNPFVAAADGSFLFFVAQGGAFEITASKIIADELWEKTIPYAAVANGAEYDFDSLFSSVSLPGLEHLLYSDETASAEHVNSLSESGALKTFSLPANTYEKIKIEAVVRSRVEQDANAKSTFTWRFKAAGNAVANGIFTEQITANSTTGIDGGNRNVSTISVIIQGGQQETTALSITAQMTVNNSATGALVHSFRVYGYRDETVTALTGERDTAVVSFAISGRPRSGEIVEGTVFVDPVSFPVDFEGSEAVSRVAAAAETVFSITRGDAEIGTVTFAADSSHGVFALEEETVFDIGESLDIVCPNPRDTTLSGVKIALRGRRIPV